MYVDLVKQSSRVEVAAPGRKVQLPEVVGERPPEVVAIVGPLQLALGPRPDLHAALVEELDLHRGGVEWRGSDGEAPVRSGRADVEPGDRCWDQLQVVAVDAARVDPGDHGPLEDAGCACGVAAPGQRGSPRLQGGVGQGQTQGHLGGDVQVEKPGHPALPEQAPGPSGLPNDRLRHDGAGLHRLEGIYLDLRLKDGALSDVALVRDDHAFFQAGSELHV